MSRGGREGGREGGGGEREKERETGERKERPTDLTPSSLKFTAAVNDSTARETTSYTSLVKTGDNSGFITYSRHLPPHPDVAFSMRFTIE